MTALTELFATLPMLRATQAQPAVDQKDTLGENESTAEGLPEPMD
jgi:hypothetical protein